MKKYFHVSLPDGAHYDARPDESLLTAAQRAHWLVRYGCRNGNCGACIANLVHGQVQHRDGATIKEKHIETDTDVEILLCLCKPLSDLEIELPHDPRPGSFDQSLRSYVRLRQQTISESESILYFVLPAGRKPKLLADQITLIETDIGLLQGCIMHEQSQGRELIIRLPFASPLHEAAYYHMRYPLSAHYEQESSND